MPDRQTDERPQESSREALLRAATTLFAEYGPAAVSTRQIAAAAKVNSGLIHRHFTTKEALLGEVLSEAARAIADTEESGPVGANLLRFLDAAQEHATFWKLLARCLLDGKSLEGMQDDFPTMRRIRALFEEMQASGTLAAELDPQAVAAALTAMALGWLVFEPWLLRASGLDDRKLADARRLMRKTALQLVGIPQPT